MTTMHTPGPWEIDLDTRPVEVCTIHGVPPQGEEGQKWVYVRGAIGDWNATEETNMANARLIAAAPEMLAALIKLDATISFKAAVATTGDLAKGLFADSAYWGAVDEAKAAIAKATAP